MQNSEHRSKTLTKYSLFTFKDTAMTQRNFVIAVDESDNCLNGVDTFCKTFTRKGDKIHLAAVQPPMLFPVAVGPAGMSSAAQVAAFQETKKIEEKRTETLLTSLQDRLSEDFPDLLIDGHLLPAVGGASGVAESLNTFCKDSKADGLILGCRGMGGLKSAMMSLIGMGSVSSYCVHNCTSCPVIIMKYHARKSKEEIPEREKGRPTVLVAVDESTCANKALEWALRSMEPTHIVSVAPATPYILEQSDVIGPGHIIEADEFQSAQHDSFHFARTVAESAAAKAKRVLGHDVIYKALLPEGGASDVGESLVNHAHQIGADMVVVGSRGMGAVRRQLLSFVGLGSVSDYIVNNVENCAVTVIHCLSANEEADEHGVLQEEEEE